MNNLETISVNLDKAVAKISKTVASGKIDGLLKDTSDVLSDARHLINHTRQEIETMNLAQKTAKTDKILETLDKRTKSIALDLQDTAENLRVTSEYLQQFAEGLNNNPSDLLFSRPAPPRKKME
jgi:ABC-type transporter Mla subunit MlaD